MATNNFKPFATAANANVTAQADWESLPALLSGFTAGKASSAQVNKAIRQASFIAAALAQYTANKSGLDVLDDGDLNGFIAKMSAAFGKDFQALDATLTALAGLTTGANKLPYFTGTDTASQTDLTSVGRDIIGKGTIADILTYLGLGELPDSFGDAASKNVGTTAGTVAAGDDSRIVNAVQPSNPALCTAWVNFSGVAPATIKSSHNVSSITRLSTGKYTINFTSPMTVINYCPVLSASDGVAQGSASAVIMLDATNPSTGQPLKTVYGFTMYFRSSAGGYDCNELNAVIYGGK